MLFLLRLINFCGFHGDPIDFSFRMTLDPLRLAVIGAMRHNQLSGNVKGKKQSNNRFIWYDRFKQT